MTVVNANQNLYANSTYDLMITVYRQDGALKDLTNCTIVWNLFDSATGNILLTKTTGSGITVTTPASGVFEVNLLPADTANLLPGPWYSQIAEITDAITSETAVVMTGTVTLLRYPETIVVGTTVNPNYLIPYLRLKVGDTNPDAYRYTDTWLETALVLAIKSLQRYWRDKYLVDTSHMVSRNSNYQTWLFAASDGIIETADEPIIVLMAAIILLEGSLENSAWDYSTWRDAEISYSNLEGGRVRDANLNRLVNELFSVVTPPTKKLARALKASLPGYLGNDYERVTFGKDM